MVLSRIGRPTLQGQARNSPGCLHFLNPAHTFVVLEHRVIDSIRSGMGYLNRKLKLYQTMICDIGNWERHDSKENTEALVAASLPGQGDVSLKASWLGV